MFDLKPLAPAAVATALERATILRVHNEPGEAESICLDVLRIDPANQEATALLIMALCDRFGSGLATEAGQVRQLTGRLRDPYQRAYYAGIVAERQALALLSRGGPGSGSMAFSLFTEAMNWYEQAEALAPAGNVDARLRWNASARAIMRRKLLPPAEERLEPCFE